MTGQASGVTYSTAATGTVADLVRDRYGLPGPLGCTLLSRGFNDVYAVRAADGGRTVLRLSGWRRRGAADVAAETEFLRYLDTAGVPVTAAVPARSGALFTELVLPEGPRAAVLFPHAEGRRPLLDAPEDAGAQGATLARLHDAAEGFPDTGTNRYRLDLDHLLHRQVAAVSTLDALSMEAREFFAALASRLALAVGRLDGLGWTRCHGDCHGLNAVIVTDGPARGQARFIDFDDGGFGYLAYDLAVYLWSQVSFGRSSLGMWHAFVAGYRSVRPITAVDLDAAHLFVPIRHIWLLGEYAGRTAEWGTAALTPAWLDQQAAFLRRWEAEKLSPRLV